MGGFEHLALADRSGDRHADFRHQEAAQHRPGSGRRGEGLQGRHEGRHRRRADRSPPSRSKSAIPSKARPRRRRSDGATRSRRNASGCSPARFFVRRSPIRMFDVGFSELVVIGVVALIVIGPERLPKVARTAGHAARPPAALRQRRQGRHQPRDAARRAEEAAAAGGRRRPRAWKQSVNEQLKSVETSLNESIAQGIEQTSAGRRPNRRMPAHRRRLPADCRRAGQAEDLMADIQETFISHLIELRDRLLRSLLAVLVVFLCLVPWSGDGLRPAGAADDGDPAARHQDDRHRRHHALHGAAQGDADGRLRARAAGRFSTRPGLSSPPACTRTRRSSPCRWSSAAPCCSCSAWPSATSSSSAPCSSSSPSSRRASITPAPDIEQYLNFVMTMFLAFGVTFEVPVVVVLLVKFGIVSVEKLKEIRPYAIVGAFVIAAVVTPPDVTSQIPAGDTDVPAVRAGSAAGALRRQSRRPMPAKATTSRRRRCRDGSRARQVPTAASR